MNSDEYYGSTVEPVPDSVRKKALEMFDHGESEWEGLEAYEVGDLFVRILHEKDWTDKLESAARNVHGRLRGRKQEPKTRKMVPVQIADTKLSAEMKALLPDMREVARAYEEMTSGYKQFIQDVLDAKRNRSKSNSKIHH